MNRRHVVLFLLVECAIGQAAGSPKASQLLPLVPENAQIVAGIEDPHNPNSHGRLLLVTHNDNLDFQDWVSLTGVDSSRRADEVIEAANSSGGCELCDHLLLVSGRFDAEQIYKAAEQNGAQESRYRKIDILIVATFPREQRELRDVRWMAILDGTISIFGTPDLVKQALDRYQAREPVNAGLQARIKRLRPDVNSWDILVMPAAMLARHLQLGTIHDPWGGAIAGTDELILGIHYGSTARVDFAIHSANERQITAIAALLEPPRVVKASTTAKWKPRIENLSVDGSRLEGSATVPGKRFDAFLDAIYRSRISKANDH